MHLHARVDTIHRSTCYTVYPVQGSWSRSWRTLDVIRGKPWTGWQTERQTETVIHTNIHTYWEFKVINLPARILVCVRKPETPLKKALAQCHTVSHPVVHLLNELSSHTLINTIDVTLIVSCIMHIHRAGNDSQEPCCRLLALQKILAIENYELNAN